jgi:methionyl-tRNA formyltransferase
MKESLNIVFMGTPVFSVPILALLCKKHNVFCVYTRPPKPKDRGQLLQYSPVHRFADENKILVKTPITLRDPEAINFFKSLSIDLVVVAAYGLIIPKNYLESPKYGFWNVHTSLLPKYRGAAPIHRALLSDDKETGITIMKIDEGLDTGDILSKIIFPISKTVTYQEAHDKLSQLGATLLIDTISEFLKGNVTPIPQPIEGTVALKITKQEGKLKFAQESSDILDKKVRVLNPKPGTYFSCGDPAFSIKVLKSRSHLIFPSQEMALIRTNFSIGDFILYNKRLFVVCFDGFLELIELQREGKKAVNVNDFLNGFSLSKFVKLHNF